MKIQHILLAAIALPQIAMAESFFTYQSLGAVQSTVDFCAQTHPQNAAKYQEQARIMLQEIAAEDLDKARSSVEYKEAYDQASSILGKVTQIEVDEACDGLLETNLSDPADQTT